MSHLDCFVIDVLGCDNAWAIYRGQTRVATIYERSSNYEIRDSNFELETMVKDLQGVRKYCLERWPNLEQARKAI
jgi:hypothetical protein